MEMEQRVTEPLSFPATMRQKSWPPLQQQQRPLLQH